MKKSCTFAPLSTESTTSQSSFGEVAEWSIAAVLKTVVLRGTRGSNPCLSAGGLDNTGHKTAKTRKTSVLRVFLLPPNRTKSDEFGHQLYTKVYTKTKFTIFGVQLVQKLPIKVLICR